MEVEKLPSLPLGLAAVKMQGGGMLGQWQLLPPCVERACLVRGVRPIHVEIRDKQQGRLSWRPQGPRDFGPCTLLSIP